MTSHPQREFHSHIHDADAADLFPAGIRERKERRLSFLDARNERNDNHQTFSIPHRGHPTLCRRTHPPFQLEAWLSQCRDGDRDARDALFAHLQHRLHALVRITRRGRFDVVRQFADTDDIAQDVSVRLLNRWEKLMSDISARMPDEPLRGFLGAVSQIIRDVLCDAVRSRLGRGREARADIRSLNDAGGRSDDSSAAFEPSQDTHDPDRLAQWEEFHQFLGALPEPLREVAELRWYHDLTHAEIGRLLGIAEVTARVRWTQARHTLQQQFSDPMFQTSP